MATIWLTGLPASGKTTIAYALCSKLHKIQKQAVVLDGDELRQGLSADLGFSPQDRLEHIRRVGALACTLNGQGTHVIVSLISPYAQSRDEVRKAHQKKNRQFFEIFVDTPLQACIQRDPKGLYAKAASGSLKGLTGIDAPYEKPVAPDLTICTTAVSIESAVEQLSAFCA